MSKNKIGICRLCKQKKKLCNSHIIPKFAIKYLKGSSPSPNGYLRYASSPNLRRQDAIKPPLLCKNCEGLLSKWETKFAEKIFIPFKKGLFTNVIYQKWLSLFAISLSWKILIQDLAKYEKEYSSSKDLRRAERCWRKMILEENPNVKKFKHYLIFLNEFKNDGNIVLPDKFYRFLLRGNDGCIIYNKEQAELYCYAKLSNVIIWSCIKPNKLKKCRKFQIKLRGDVKNSQKKQNRKVINFLIQRALYATNLYDKISPKQINKVKKTISKNPKRAINSETYKAYLKDKK